MIMLMGLVWVAFLVCLMIGWNWKPKWVSLGVHKSTNYFSKLLDSLPLCSSCRWLVVQLKGFASASCFNSSMVRTTIGETEPFDNPQEKLPDSLSSPQYDHRSSSQLKEEQSSLVNCLTEEDVEHLYKLVQMKDGGSAWIQMMDRSTPGMSYQAWSRDSKSGPTEYRSKTVFENATPEIVRDFFWDDEFRANWDDMLAYSNTIEDCALTGAVLVQWIRKFPFFCREYIIVRRIWESSRSYYCVTKGANCPSVPRRNKPKRVDLYYSSWFIRAVESRTGNGQMTACEVLFFHHEEMGIPREIAKLAVRQGMWGAVKNFEPSLRAYQKARSYGIPLSPSAIMAQITTKINLEPLSRMAAYENSAANEAEVSKDRGKKIPKWFVVGGAILIICIIDKGLLTEAFIFGLGRKFANIGKGLQN